MKIRALRHGDVLELEVTGTVGGEPPHLFSEVRKHLEAGERKIVVNLLRANRVSSTGAGDLIHSKTLADQAGAAFATVFVPPTSILDGPGMLLEQLNNHHSLHDALKFLTD